jgi:hypothetical protein
MRPPADRLVVGAHASHTDLAHSRTRSMCSVESFADRDLAAPRETTFGLPRQKADRLKC